MLCSVKGGCPKTPNFLQLGFLPAGDHSLANDRSLAPTARRSGDAGQPSAATRDGLTGNHSGRSSKATLSLPGAGTGVDVGGYIRVQEKVLPQTFAACYLIIQKALSLLHHQILHQQKFKITVARKQTYGTGAEMFSLKATLGFPMVQGQPYSLSIRCRKKQQNETPSCPTGTIPWKFISYGFF